jgi:hypothetical protein
MVYKLLALAGARNAGKDTVLDYLQQIDPTIVRVKYATYLQDIAAYFIGIYDEDNFSHRDKFLNNDWKGSVVYGLPSWEAQKDDHVLFVVNSICPDEYLSVTGLDAVTQILYRDYILEQFNANYEEYFHNGKLYTPRDIQIGIGDFCRDYLHSGVSTAILRKELLDDKYKDKKVVITDLRTPIEARLVKQLNGSIAYIHRQVAIDKIKNLNHITEPVFSTITEYNQYIGSDINVLVVNNNLSLTDLQKECLVLYNIYFKYPEGN